MSSIHNTFDAEAFVSENQYPLSFSDYSRIGLEIRCIDDRSSDSDDCKHDIAIPGSGLGLVMDALGAFTLLRRKGKHATIAPEEAVKAVERALGAVYFHTDEKSVRNRGVACGGCGHCSGALVEPVKYLLSESDAKYFVEKGLADIKESLKARAVKPAVYKGHHDARAIFIIEGTEVGLPSVGKSSERAYVYHQGFHEMFLKLIEHEISPLLSSHAHGVSEEEFLSALSESAQARLAVTIQRLAPTLPKFIVRRAPEVSVSAA